MRTVFLLLLLTLTATLAVSALNGANASLDAGVAGGAAVQAEGEEVVAEVSEPAGGTPTPTPTNTFTPTPTSPDLPDLVVSSMHITLETGGDCNYTSTQLGVRVVIGNVGSADARPFVVEVNGSQQAVGSGLAAGDTLSLWFAGFVLFDENAAFVDATFQVEESNEENNELTQILAVPTLPPTCTPTPTATATATPTHARSRGDVNKDGVINSIDAFLVLQFRAGIIFPSPDPENGDVNDDGAVNGIDASLILQYHAGLISRLP